MRRLWKLPCVLLGACVLAAAGVIAWLSLAEYRPEDVETLSVRQGAIHEQAEIGAHYTLVTLNVGYGGLDREADFFMDGGTGILPQDERTVQANLDGIISTLALQNADVILLQEVDTDSKRSFGIDEAETFRHGLSMGSAFAYNYRCAFVPYPWPPMGRINSGLQTLTRFAVTEATREALPCSYGWPVSIANLKRCLLVERVPIKDSEQELVLLNLHLDAYTDDESRTKQTKRLLDILTAERRNGNYVIAGGDFNQAFPDTANQFGTLTPKDWLPGQLAEDELPNGFSFAYDASLPSCRSLSAAYGEQTPGYVIDGFILSDNVKVNNVETVNVGFRYSDHQPVRLEFTLR